MRGFFLGAGTVGITTTIAGFEIGTAEWWMVFVSSIAVAGSISVSFQKIIDKKEATNATTE